MYKAKGKNMLILVAAILSMLTLSSCSVGRVAEPEEGFGLYLAESGELVLSEAHIKAFYRDDCTFELNEKGIDKWNSYLTYRSSPKLADSLYGRDFVLKIDGEEVCRGKFWSLVSSASYSGVVILDCLFKLDGTHNRLSIKSGYPWHGSPDAAIESALVRFFEGINLLQ